MGVFGRGPLTTGFDWRPLFVYADDVCLIPLEGLKSSTGLTLASFLLFLVKPVKVKVLFNFFIPHVLFHLKHEATVLV